MKVNAFLLSLTLSFAAIVCNAQDKGALLLVEVNDSNASVVRYEGYIADGTTQDVLKLFVIKSGSIITIPFSEVVEMRKIGTKSETNNPPSTNKEDVSINDVVSNNKNDYSDLSRSMYAYKVPPRHRDYGFEEQGLYGRIELDFHEMIAGIGGSFGYKFNRLFSLGAGISLSAWDWDPDPAGVTSLFVQSIGYFEPSNTSFYYVWELGASIPKSPRSSNWSNYSSAEAGLYGSGGLGWRWRGASEIQNGIEVGFQYSHLKYNNLESTISQRTYKITRFYFSFVTMF